MEKAKILRRRRVPRREFFRRIGLLVSGRYHISRGVQIGEGGMLIQSEEPLAVGQKIVISFKLPGINPDVVTAAVRYVLNSTTSSNKRYGVEFLNLDFNVKRDIRNYVASQAQILEDNSEN